MTEICQILNPKQKALQINLDNRIYGTFAEIGAGQEVARQFFQAGGAAGTIAKTISAYDMKMSDKVYGREKSGRYVCQDRLAKMLEHEYEQTIDILKESRPKDSRFFVFANTVAAKSYNATGECHGWLGVRFQHVSLNMASQVIIHIRMLDKENIQQQQAIGLLGVNLIYACYFYHSQMNIFLDGLMDNIGKDRLEIDMIKTLGPAFKEVDDRILSLGLVRRNYTNAVMFENDGSVVYPRDLLYKKHVFVHRGGFRPPTFLGVDMLEKGLENFKNDLKKDKDNTQAEIIPLTEISMNRLAGQQGEVDSKDFLARVDLLSILGRRVLISNFSSFDQLNAYLSSFTRYSNGFVLNFYSLRDLFKEESLSDPHYLSRIAYMFSHHARYYLYPSCSDDGKGFLSLDQLGTSLKILYLKKFFIENNQLCAISNYNKKVVSIWSRQVIEMLQKGDRKWQEMVPEIVKEEIIKKKLFGVKK